MSEGDVVLAITGASGVAYAVRLLEVLLATERRVHLSISPSAQLVLRHELGAEVNLEHFEPRQLLLGDDRSPVAAKLTTAMREVFRGFSNDQASRVVYHNVRDLTAPIASGSFLTGGMVICPCSGSTLGAVVHGTGENLIHRAAAVHLKERRKLILVPRETPLSGIQLENMLRADRAGAVVLPAAPGFYQGVDSIRDLVDFVVARICDQLGIANSLSRRWGSQEK